MESNLAWSSLRRQHSHNPLCFDLIVLAKKKIWGTKRQHFFFTNIGSSTALCVDNFLSAGYFITLHWPEEYYAGPWLL